jgi:aspartate/glutamate racemase
LFQDIKNAELTGANIIVTTCSTLTPIVDMIRPFIKVPLIAIDDQMAKLGVTFGENILVMATAESTVEPTKLKLTKEAINANVKINIYEKVCPEAFKAMKAMDMDNHDKLLKEMAREVKGYDCIILAQASMAHLEDEIRNICNCPVLSSPDSCIRQVNEILKTI